MKKRYIIGLVGFIVLLAAAVAAYNYLSDNVITVNPPETEKISESVTAPVSSETSAIQSSDVTESTTEAQTSAADSTTVEVTVSETEQTTEPPTPEPLELHTADFKVYDLDGNAVNLSDFLGKPIIVNFWATWCEPCVAELPDFEKLYKEQGTEVEFLMISLPMGGNTIEKVKKFVDKNGYSFPVYYDTEYSASEAYGIRAVPQTLFINNKGELVQHCVGSLSGDSLIEYYELIKP